MASLFIASGQHEARQDHTIHHHHLLKGIWISIGLFLLLTVLTPSLINTRNDLKVYEANDIKYRHLKVNSDTASLRLLFKIDSLFLANPETFTKETIQEENRIAERARLLRRARDKEREGKELIKKAKEI
jgi:hypothetical protein